jgi:2-dehydropantoate 2-reductase
VKICIYGAGAIGGYLAVRLAMTDNEISVVARGKHLEAIKENGLTLIADGEKIRRRVLCSDNPKDFPTQDYVIVAVKAHTGPSIARALQPLLGAKTVVVPAVNGIPWWYFYKSGGRFDGYRLRSVDPGGEQWNLIRPERVIGCVVYPAAEIAEPGVIRHISLNRFPIGEPDGSRSDRALLLSQVFMAAGLRAPVRKRIRDDIWVKLWGNMSFNPVSVLTGATLGQIGSNLELRGVVREMMIEAQEVGESLGISFPVDVDRRIVGATDVGDHKTSSLQDLEAGKEIELDALLGVVCELGELAGVKTPTCNMINALAGQRAALVGSYQPTQRH